MRFASQEFFNHLKSELQDENGDVKIYDDISKMIERETKWKLLNSVDKEEDREDILQEIKMAVIKGLPNYILNSETLHEAQRQTWLNAIVEHKISNWRKKPDNGKHDSIDRTVKDEGGNEYFPKELEKATASMQNEPESIHMDETISEAFGSVLHDIFSINVSPERLIGFVYSKMIIPRMIQSKYSGKPTEAEKILRNVTLYEIYDNIVADFKGVFCSNIDETVFAPLKEKLNIRQKDGSLVGNRRFNLTVRQIVDGSNRINQKVQDMYKVYLERLEGEMSFEDKTHKF